MILTLAICLGANAAIFTVVHAVLLRPLPVPEADRIVGIGDVYPTITPNDILSNDVPSYFDRLERGARRSKSRRCSHSGSTRCPIDGVAEEIRGMRATPSLFRVAARARRRSGRTFTDAEGEIGAEHKVILSDGLWQRLYGGDPAVIGQPLRLGVDRAPLHHRRRDAAATLRSSTAATTVTPERRAGRPVLDSAGVYRRRRSRTARAPATASSTSGGCDRARRSSRCRRRSMRARRERQAVSAVSLHRAWHVQRRDAAAGRA